MVSISSTQTTTSKSTTTLNLTTDPLEIARQYRDLLGNVVPLGHDKNPIVAWKNGAKNWTEESQTDSDLAAMPWHNARGIAAVMGAVSNGLRVVDFDKQPDRATLDRFLNQLNIPTSYQWIVKTPGGGFHVELNAHGLTAPDDSAGGRVDRDGVHGGHIELRHDGILVTLPPSRHPSGGRYVFINGTPTAPPLEVDPADLIAAYDAITIKPAPKPAPVYDVPNVNLPSDASELLEVEYRVRAEIARHLEKRGSKEGYFCCPQDHGRDGKDFLFGVEPGSPIGGCQGKHAGELTRWTDLAEFLKIDVSQIARDVALERRPERPATSHSSRDSSSSRFPKGLPYTIDKWFSTAHRTIDGIENQSDVAALLYLWHEIPEAMISSDTWVKWGDLEQAGQQLERNPKRHLLETALTKAVSWGIVETVNSTDLQPVAPDDQEICENCNLINAERSIYRTQDSQIFFVSTLRANTRPTPLYRFKPWPEQLRAIVQRRRYHQREQAFKYDADTVQPEWGDLTEDQIAAWNDYRAPIYDADHQKALAQFDQQMEHLENSVAAIERGTNWVLILPPGDIGNARDYRILKGQARTAEQDIPRGKLARDLGVSKSTLARDYAAMRVIPIEQTKVVAAESVTDYQRDHGLVIREFDNGKVAIKTASLLRSVDRAGDEERAAFEALQQKQAEIRNLRSDREPDRVDALRTIKEHDPDLYPPPEKSLTIPNNYTDDHKRNQYKLFPLPADFPNYDPETGEVPQTIDELWRVGADWLLARDKRIPHEQTQHENAAYETQADQIITPETAQAESTAIHCDWGQDESATDSRFGRGVGSRSQRTDDSSDSRYDAHSNARQWLDGARDDAQRGENSSAERTLGVHDRVAIQKGTPAPPGAVCAVCGKSADRTLLDGYYCAAHAACSFEERYQLLSLHNQQYSQSPSRPS